MTRIRQGQKVATPTEAAILKAILQYLALCPKVALAWRVNSGAVRGSYTRKSDGVTRERFVRFNGAPGISDVIGCMKGGRLIAVEVKRPGKKATEDQASFLDAVRKAGGVAILAYSVDDVVKAMEER